MFDGHFEYLSMELFSESRNETCLAGKASVVLKGHINNK